MLIDDAKMSSAEGLGFKCCLQTSVIPAEVLSIHHTLHTGAVEVKVEQQ